VNGVRSGVFARGRRRPGISRSVRFRITTYRCDRERIGGSRSASIRAIPTAVSYTPATSTMESAFSLNTDRITRHPIDMRTPPGVRDTSITAISSRSSIQTWRKTAHGLPRSRPTGPAECSRRGAPLAVLSSCLLESLNRLSDKSAHPAVAVGIPMVPFHRFRIGGDLLAARQQGAA